MKSIIQDIIHLTEWEFAIKYWYLELALVIVAIIVINKQYKKDLVKLNKKWEKLDFRNKKNK